MGPIWIGVLRTIEIATTAARPASIANPIRRPHGSTGGGGSIASASPPTDTNPSANVSESNAMIRATSPADTLQPLYRRMRTAPPDSHDWPTVLLTAHPSAPASSTRQVLTLSPTWRAASH